MVKHQYQKAGTYTVTLTAKNAKGVTGTKVLSVEINHPLPAVSFIAAGGECPSPCEVIFTDTSAHATSYTWDFADGTPVLSSEEMVVKHTFQQAGTYAVMLTAKNADGVAQSKTVEVLIYPARYQMLTAKFWQMTNKEMMQNGVLTSVWGNVPFCLRDNRFEFTTFSSSTYYGRYKEVDEGSLCAPLANHTGTWRLLPGDSTLNITYLPTYNVNFKIVTQTPTTLKLSDSPYLITYTAQ